MFSSIINLVYFYGYSIAYIFHCTHIQLKTSNKLNYKLLIFLLLCLRIPSIQNTYSGELHHFGMNLIQPVHYHFKLSKFLSIFMNPTNYVIDFQVQWKTINSSFSKNLLPVLFLWILQIKRLIFKTNEKQSLHGWYFQTISLYIFMVTVSLTFWILHRSL